MVFWRKNAINRVILTMVYADLLMISATGFISPISAVFITTQIAGATIATVGFVTTLFWVVKSAFQVPISAYVDGQEGERDDYWMMIFGIIITAVVPLLYYFYAHEVWHVFAIETLNGIGYAMSVPTFLAIFTRHIDKHRESSEWTVHSNAVGLGFAATAAVGGVLADKFGFRVLFLLVSAFTFLGAVALLAVKDEMKATDGHDGLAEVIALSEKDRKPRG